MNRSIFHHGPSFFGEVRRTNGSRQIMKETKFILGLLAMAALTVLAAVGSAGAALALTAFAYPLVFWTLRGMEVGLLAWLVTVAAHRVILYSRGRPPADLRAAGILMALALWTRGYLLAVRGQDMGAVSLQ